MSTFCQHSYHRKCQRKGVGGQKKPKTFQRSMRTTPYFGRIIFNFPLVKKAAFLIKRYFVASMGAKVEVLAHPGDKYCEDRQAG